MDAADVLPCWSTVTINFSSGNFSFLAVLCMMRMLAWCGINQSMSACVMFAFASVARAELSSTPTASLNTAWPSIFKSASPTTLPPETLPGTHKIPTCLPSACRSVAKMPGTLDAASTTAPAPSPKSTQVVRSEKSRMREKTSAPTTNALLALPVLIMASATLSA